jgi:hypothetical protein
MHFILFSLIVLCACSLVVCEIHYYYPFTVCSDDVRILCGALHYYAD